MSGLYEQMKEVEANKEKYKNLTVDQLTDLCLKLVKEKQDCENMNKLEEKFETIIYENTGGTTFHMSDDALNAAKVCVEEAKQLAIEFAKWYYENKQTHMYDEEHFNEFLEEHYG